MSPSAPSSPASVPGCALCDAPGGSIVWQDPQWRVIRPDDPDHPAFYRVVLRRHEAEFSALDDGERRRCMALVVAVERVLIERLRPTKVNLAALGNVVPHLHWHVIARFDWDSHFPQPVWGVRQRVVEPAALTRLPLSLAELDTAVRAALDHTG